VIAPGVVGILGIVVRCWRWRWMGRQRVAPAKRRLIMEWEYKCVAIWGLGEATTRALNEYGRQGWELVCAWGPWHYFKRPLD